MTDNERDVERRITTLESNVNNLIEELRDFKTEMRQQNQMRAEELRDLQNRHDSDMREMNKKIDDKFDKLSEQIHTMTIAAVVGFGAIAAEVGGLVFAAFK